MKKFFLFLLINVLLSTTLLGSDYFDAQKQRDVIRSDYWRKKGYNFNPDIMTAYSMDRKVEDIKRADYWRKEGFDFNPDFMTAYSMDRKVEDIKRADYWRKKGFNFNPDFMTAYSMDRKVEDIKRADYWRKKGFNFNPDFMTAYSMDRKVEDIKRADYWRKEGYDFNPDFMTAYSMNQQGNRFKKEDLNKNSSFCSIKNTVIKLGGSISFENQTKELALSLGDKTGSISIKNSSFEFEGKRYPLKNKPKLVNGSALISKDDLFFVFEKMREDKKQLEKVLSESTYEPNLIAEKPIAVQNLPANNKQNFPNFSGAAFSPGITSVRGYFKKDGTFVLPHFRTRKDSLRINNWSTKGNKNPFTGKKGYKW